MKATLILAIIFLSASRIWSQPLDRSIRPAPGPAPVISLGVTDTFSLPNGLKVFVVENHKLPTIDCNLELAIKPELEGNMAGFKDMLSELLLAGTSTRSKNRINEEIDGMGAHLEATADNINGNGLKKYASKILELMADIAANAVFSQEELDRVKEKTLSELESIKDDPDAMVSNVSSVVNFGRKHPYGEIPTPVTVKNVTLDRCRNYYHTYFRPNVGYLAIVGDVTRDEVKPMVEKYFGKWQKKEVPESNYEVAGLNGERPTEVDFIPNESAVQSVVNITYPIELKPGEPDVILAEVANTILGGGSMGRLFQDLREKHGWTYGAYSSITPDEIGGTFAASVKCRNAVTDSAIQAILDEMKSLQNEKVTDSALKNAISYLSGSFAIGLENPRAVAQYAINIVRYHLPPDYYGNYLKNLQAVNRGDIIEKARKYFLPANANIVVAGNKDEVADKLARFSTDGKVNFYDNEGNSSRKLERVEAPPGVTAATIMQNYIKAIGGEAAIDSIRDIKITGSSKIQGSEFIITEIKKAPDMWVKNVEMNNKGMKMPVQKMAYNGAKGFQESNGQKVLFTVEDIAEIAEQADMYACLHPATYGITRVLKGMETFGGSNVYVVEATDRSNKTTMEYYDTASGLLVKKMQGTAGKTQVSVYADYRDVPGGKGYKIPYLITEKAGANTFSETISDVAVNTGIPDSEFD